MWLYIPVHSVLFSPRKVDSLFLIVLSRIWEKIQGKNLSIERKSIDLVIHEGHRLLVVPSQNPRRSTKKISEVHLAKSAT